MTTHFNIGQDLHIFAAMVEHLTPYVYEDELFGHINNSLPKLTLGGLLMRRYRLHALQDMLRDEQAQAFHDAESQLQSIRYEWLSHYRNKLIQEFDSRTHAIQWFLEDCARTPQSCDANWPNEAEKRTIIAHLADEAIEQDAFSPSKQQLLNALDQNMRRFYRKGDFIWDPALEKIYRPDRFWWLYGRPGERLSNED